MSDDLISRSELKKHKFTTQVCNGLEIEDVDVVAVATIDNAPTVERPQGEWVAVDSYSAFGGSEETWLAHGNPIAIYYCSNCKNQAYANDMGEDILSKFCPECGADMRGDRQ